VGELTDTIQVTGIRCERCVNRLALALQDHKGLLAANANLMGRVLLTWDDDVTDRDSLIGAMSRAGFREVEVGAGETSRSAQTPPTGPVSGGAAPYGPALNAPE
jgi:copper chaperone CopZ